jgi:hypothetical protein
MHATTVVAALASLVSGAYASAQIARMPQHITNG